MLTCTDNIPSHNQLPFLSSPLPAESSGGAGGTATDISWGGEERVETEPRSHVIAVSRCVICTDKHNRHRGTPCPNTEGMGAFQVKYESRADN